MRVMASKESATAPADLARTLLFRSLDDEQRAQVLEQADLVEVAAGETIVEEGKPADELFVLLAGQGQRTRAGCRWRADRGRLARPG